jgi:DNA-binding IclR family transcriptional regulator
MSDSRKIEATRGSQTLARGLSILAALRDAPEGLSVADLVRALALHRAIVTRLLVTLEDQRYVERTGARTYRLGPELVSLGRAVRADVRDVAATVLATLAEQVRATVVLVVRDGSHAVVISVTEPLESDLRLSFRLGSRHPLRQGAEGMAILAGNPPIRGERAEVTEARRVGYAVSADEILAGTWGLAVPVVASGGGCDMSVGVISAQVLDEHETARRVSDATVALAERLGLRAELR